MNTDLAKKWMDFKRQEDAAKKARLEVEQAIEGSGFNFKRGANDFEGMLTITADNSRTFDQDALRMIDEEGFKPFPFKRTYKEVCALTKDLEEKAPEIWAEKYEPLLVVKPKKLSFKIR